MDVSFPPPLTAPQWEEFATTYVKEASSRDILNGCRIAELDIDASETGVLEVGTADGAFLIALWKKLYHQDIRIRLVGVDFCSKMIAKAKTALKHEAETNPSITADVTFLLADVNDIGTETAAGQSIQQKVLHAAPHGISTIACFDTILLENRQQYDTYRAHLLNMVTIGGKVVLSSGVPHYSWQIYRQKVDKTSTMTTIINLGTQAVVNDILIPWREAARQNDDPSPVLVWKALVRFAGNRRTSLPIGACMINSCTAVTVEGAVVYVSKMPLRMKNYNAQYFEYLTRRATADASCNELGQQMQNPSIKHINFDTLSSSNWALLNYRFREEITPLNTTSFGDWLKGIDPDIDARADAWDALPTIMITWKRREAKAGSGVTGWK